MRTDTWNQRALGTAAAALAGAGCAMILLTLSACASVENRNGSKRIKPVTTDFPRGTSRRDGDAVSESEQPRADDFSRHANVTAGLVGSMLKTYTTDPFVRPVSTVKSLGFLVKNFVTDVSRRAYVNTVKLPAIKGSPIPPLSNEPPMDLAEWERELDRLTGSKLSAGTLDFLIDGEAFFPAFIEHIEGAEQSIQLRTYIFDNDDYAMQIADLLKERSRQVDVTVLMDGIGSLTGAHVKSASLPDSHVAPGSIAQYLETDSRVRARLLTNPWFTGDHCKVAVIDRKVAFLGGMNIGREYRYDWHDLMVKIEGPVVEALARDADNAWAQSGPWGDFAGLAASTVDSEAPRSEEGYPIRVLYTEAGSSQIYDAKIAAIRRARRYIYLENPYFSDDVILYELIKARRRGVDVRYIISSGGDHPLMDMSNAKVINEMVENGIRVYLYPRMTHTKAAIIDGWLTVGTANLDHLSLRVNKEVNIATSHPLAVQALKQELFHRDFDASSELEQPLPIQLANHLAEILADVFM